MNFMKFRILSTIILALITTLSFSQKKLKGKVIDAANNNPLAGATVSFAGKGTTTDAGGTFTVDCGKSSSITISFVGYQTTTRAINNCNEEVVIALAPLAG